MSEIDYLKEAKEFFEISHRQDWMNDRDWQEFLEAYNKMDVFSDELPSLEDIAAALKIGVEKGYSIETQKALARHVKNK